jgi:hypothetical protein
MLWWYAILTGWRSFCILTSFIEGWRRGLCEKGQQATVLLTIEGV